MITSLDGLGMFRDPPRRVVKSCSGKGHLSLFAASSTPVT